MARHHNINGNIVPFTAEEEAQRDAEETAWNNGALDRALENLRFDRNNLLKKTDWMANSDVTMSDEWKNYRQQLRDITSGLDTVEKVKAKKFPEKPSD